MPSLADCRWPQHRYCQQQVLLLSDFAYSDRFSWTLPTNTTRAAALAATAAHSQSNTTTQQGYLPPALLQRLGPGYNGSLPVHYINSTWMCEQPSAACTGQPTNGTGSPCLLAAYAELDPDAAATGPAAGSAGSSNNHGVSVVLPAVLGSVGKAVIAVGQLTLKILLEGKPDTARDYVGGVCCSLDLGRQH